MKQQLPLDLSDLAWTCDDPKLELAPEAGVLIGQERAIEALKLGMELYGPGFNMFVTGLTGTRRAQGVKALLESIRAVCQVVPDRVYVYNFAEPNRPSLLTFEGGEGERFVADLEQFFVLVMTAVPKSLAAPALAERRRAMQKQYAASEHDLYRDLVDECKAAGLALVTLGEDESAEPDIFPIIDEQPVPPEALEALVQEGKLSAERAKAMTEARDPLVAKLYVIRSQAQEIAREMLERIRGLDRAAAAQTIGPELGTLRERWTDPGCERYLVDLEAFILKDLGTVVGYARASAEAGLDEVRRPKELEARALPRVAKSQEAGDCPVVFEANPTYENLFGTILPPDEDGPRLSHIEIGSLLRADGGYLVLRLTDLLADAAVWTMLKRVFKTGRLEIRSQPTQAPQSQSPLKPDPVEVCAKLVVIGEIGTYELLCSQDPEFTKVFKVHAPFDTTMERSDANIARYGAFVAGLRMEEGLLEPTPCAVGRLAERGARLAGSKRRLSTRFGELADLYREASHLARKRGAKMASRADVLAAEHGRERRVSLTFEKYLESVQDGRMRLDVTGEQVGQVNGLVVIDTGAWVHGRPSRISAQVGVGSRGVIDIERESELSGQIHEKGIQILGGYLLGTFARHFPLCLSATLCFEQSYSGVDGDSASSTELYAILSALSGIPLRQGIAVTGSVDQFGRVQAVGGVNEKIEGYFRVARLQGDAGSVGVMIPKSNIDSLMLDPQVVEAVAAGHFRVYAVESIAEGLEVLTGVPAGEPDPASEGTVLGLAARRLAEFAEAYKPFR